MNKLVVRAPSNIAIVKYMGKKDYDLNLPANGSLSLTLDQLCTVAEFSFQPLSGTREFSLLWKTHREKDFHPTPKEFQRLEKHLKRISDQYPACFEEFGLQLKGKSGQIELSSQNTFPSNAGMASSASSFAALTVGLSALLSADPAKFISLFRSSTRFQEKLSFLSRQGSGSSCRSFCGPWALWEDEFAKPVQSQLEALSCFVVVVSRNQKKRSSSEAHRQVLESPLWQGRPERATDRLMQLQEALKIGDLQRVSQIAWKELWEMHSLFHTSSESFSYFEPGTLQVLQWVSSLNEFKKGEVIVTMDAGPNVHLLVPQTKSSEWKNRLADELNFSFIEDQQGQGVQIEDSSYREMGISG